MYLDYDAKHKRSEMLREAEQRRLAHIVEQDIQMPSLQLTVLDALGHQLIRLGTSLTRTSSVTRLRSQPVAETECCPA